MNELSNYELCLLMRLCHFRWNRYSRSDFKDSRLEEHLAIWTKFKDVVNSYCNEIVVEVDETSRQEGLLLKTILSIEIKDKSLLNNFLDNYIFNLQEDSLKMSKNDISFEALLNEFVNSIDKTKKLKEYYIDNTKYIPIILWGLQRKRIILKEMNFELFPTDEQCEYIPKIKFKKIQFGRNDLEFGAIVDLYDFVKSYKSKVTEKEPIEFTESQIHLLELAKERLIEGNEIITKMDIEGIFSNPDKKCKTPLNKRISSNVRKTNKAFQQATGKDLIRKQEAGYYYDTSDEYDIIATVEDINIAFNKMK